MFDPQQEIEVALVRDKINAPVRWPDDEEWIARQRAIHTYQRRTADGTRTVVEGVEEASLALYEKIKRDDAPQLDEFQAALLVSKLEEASLISEPEQTEEGVIFRVRVFGKIDTVHVLRVPTEREVRTHRKKGYQTIDKRANKSEIRGDLAEVARFYRSLVVRTEGYACREAPAIHAPLIVGELLNLMDEMEEG